ncbi:MAG: Maf family protein [Clostridia bacterium]|nr:Maf family protein [Clostridia bacterium]
MKYILASGSPRRKELFAYICKDFAIVTADIKEFCPDEIPIEKRPEYLALQKAEAVAKSNKDAVVIGADTAVFSDGEMLGKPKDRFDAEKMLKRLSGKTHTVITGCAIVCGQEKRSFSVETRVKFLTLDDNRIADYIKTGEPVDKAGAYGIQGFGSLLVESINGDYFNVVGLPVSRLNQELQNFQK